MAGSSPSSCQDTLGRFVVFMAPIVFATELLCAWGVVGDWITAAFIAVVVTPIPVGLMALFWRRSSAAVPDE
jgi:hypothetical protein